MVGKYKVITLCGSTRFKDEFMESQKRLTLEGNIVISVGLFGHAGDAEVWENMDEGTLTKTKEMLDDMHKRKIDMADEIYVINVGGYIGSSTKSEIEYANATGKGIRYLAAWAEAVYGQKLKNPERESEEQLSALTTGLLMQHHRIIIDSVRIIHTTKNAETRQGRVELCQRHYGDMLKLKPFCNKEQLAMIQNAEEAIRGI